MKTAQLTGPTLDYWVAKAEGWVFWRNKRDGITISREGQNSVEFGNYPPRFDGETGAPLPLMSEITAFEMEGGFYPSSDWAYGGPIIEREGIELQVNWVTYSGVARNARTREGGWHAELEHPARVDGVQRSFALGDTPLIAAMRAYVASRFGDEVSD